MPDLVVQKITEQAHRQGYTLGEDPNLEFLGILEDTAYYDGQLYEIMTLDGRDDVPQEITHHENAVDDDEIVSPSCNGERYRPSSSRYLRCRRGCPICFGSLHIPGYVP